MKIERILVPVDGSDGAQAALDHAIDLLPGHPAELLVVLALEPIPLRLGAQVTLRGENVRMLADEQRLIAEDRLAQLESDLRERGLRVRTLLGTGPADEVILRAAKKHAADLILMSTHARSGIAHALLGSITEKVMRGATCPVLTIRGYNRKRGRKAR
jgi:nucleotide-binding universal stress UspA family protein